MRETSAATQLGLITLLLALTGCSPIASEGPEGALEDIAIASPIADAFAPITQVRAEDAAASRGALIAGQEAIAACMKDEGFDYIPFVEPEASASGSARASDGPAPGSLEFARGYGYGIVEWPELTWDADLPDAPVNPNLAILGDLSPTARAEYNQALTGKTIGPDDAGTQDFPDPEAPGCINAVGAREQETPSFAGLFEDPEVSSLFDALTAFFDDPPRTSDRVELNQEWRRCVTNEGVAISDTPSDLRERLDSEYTALGYPEGEGSDFVDPGDRARRVFQETEIFTAVVDAECQQKLNYQRRIQVVEQAAEQKFVDEHRDEIDALIARSQCRHRNTVGPGEIPGAHCVTRIA